MLNYLLRRISILHHFSSQRFTSVVISLQTFIWHRACQDALDKSHCYFVCFHKPACKVEGRMVIFSTSSSDFIFLLVQKAPQPLYHKGYFQSKRIRFQLAGVYSVGTVHLFSHPPAIIQKLRLNDFFFPPKATVTGCYLLDLQSTCCLCAAFDWLAVCLFCLLTLLPVDLLVYVSLLFLYLLKIYIL